MVINHYNHLWRFDTDRNGDLTAEELIEAILAFTDDKEHLNQTLHQAL